MVVRGGVAIHTYTIFGLPIVKVRHYRNKMRIYFCGLEVLKKVVMNKHNKWYILGMEFSNTWWGRYGFPQNSSATVRKQCLNTYAINERLFPKKGKKNK